ncbi:MAG TPA: phosphoadenylyl-sulfate reductase [Tepidisphaeraceae bacterium]|jgi:phosphoadenosine phosphosulfate reductase
MLQLQLDPASINALLDTHSPSEVISWAQETFSDGLVMSSSFGSESAALLHLVTQIVPDIRIIFVNTGYLFPETHQFMEQLRQRLNLNVWTYHTKSDPIQYLKDTNELDASVRNDVPRCCAVNKNEPFERALRELAPKAWIRGIRRQQATTRRDRQVLEWSPRYNCYAVSPLLNWSTRQLHAYLQEHDLPYHPLYEKGYPSIGCNPLSCTRPIQIGEDPRAGRWAGSTKTECGLHLESDGSGI